MTVLSFLSATLHKHLLPTIGCRDRFALMPEFLADGQPGLVVCLPLFRGQTLAVRPSCSRTLPAGQLLVASLGIPMAQSVHAGQACSCGVALVDPQLLHVTSMGRDQGAEADQASCPFEYISLCLCSNGNGSWLAALGPAGLELDVVFLIRIARLELHGLLAPQAEGPLQFEAHPDVLVLDLAELGFGEIFGFGFIRDETPVRNAVMCIRSCNDVLLVDLGGPPAQRGHTIFYGPDREILLLPVLDQGLDVLGLQ